MGNVGGILFRGAVFRLGRDGGVGVLFFLILSISAFFLVGEESEVSS